MSHTDHIKHKLALLPDEPGCYLHKNEYGEVIYVGKAKNLKNRVRSYFTGAHDIKTMRLVAEIRDFEYIVTASELEALLLEMTLIKKYDPKYNIRLKDDKTYPYIKITNEPYPRLLTTRKLKKTADITLDRIRTPMRRTRRNVFSINCIRCGNVSRCRRNSACIIISGNV